MPGNGRITVYMLNNTNTVRTTNTSNLDRVMAEIGNADLHRSMSRAVERTIGRTNATSDIVQSALVNMIKHAETFDQSKGSMLNWGCRIAANLARNWRKASANRNHDSQTMATEDSEAVDLCDTLVAEDGRLTVLRASERKALAAAINTLDDDSQTFLDAMAGGMGQCEAGALVGWSPATTTRRYRAITATIADKL